MRTTPEGSMALMRTLPFSSLLVISPHTDDAELGCGAVIARCHAQGIEVHIAHFSDTSNISGSQFGTRLRLEATSAAKDLGVSQDRLHFFNFPTRHFSHHRQEILDSLLSLKNMVQPDLVIGPQQIDKHQDHSTMAHEIPRAFSGSTTILGFDTYWNLNTQRVPVVFEVSQEHLDAKILAVAKYSSQVNRPYVAADVLRAQARLRALPRGLQLAEAFSSEQLCF